MSSAFSHTSSFTKTVIMIAFFLLAYLIYSLTKHIYSGYKIDQYIEAFQDENEVLEDQIQQKNEDYLYFTSEEYIDKIAKQSMNLVNPGEEVIILTDGIVDEEIVAGDLEMGFATYEGMSVREQWWSLFFGKGV